MQRPYGRKSGRFAGAQLTFLTGDRRHVCGAFRQEKAELPVGWNCEVSSPYPINQEKKKNFF